MSLTTTNNVYCIIGDLSFFYDQNALWNTRLKGNFRIILLNNGGGKIFQHVKGMPANDIRDTFVSAEHRTSAQGICQQNGVKYLVANNKKELQKGVTELISHNENCPIVLEVNFKQSAGATA